MINFVVICFGRSNFTACVIEGKLIVIGGFNGNSTCSNVEFFDDGCGEVGLEFHQGIETDLFENSTPAQSNQEIFMDRDQDAPSSYTLSRPEISSLSDLENSQRSSGVTLVRRHRSGLRNGKWRHLPSMKMSRSALSCCVLTGLSPNHLNSLTQNDS